MFILVDTDETRNGRVIEYFRVTEVEVPAVQILNLTSDARYKLPAEEVTTENLRRFCQSYLEGTAKVDFLLRMIFLFSADGNQITSFMG